MEPRLLVLLALATVAIAGPIKVRETTNCATQCPPSTKVNYAPGTTYLYDYRVDYSTSMSGASEDSAKLTMTTTAELEVLSPCEMVLSLRDTRLFHSDAQGGLKAADRENSFVRDLESSPLRFSFQNGAIEHICTANREEPWVMNVKKGVLTAFQNNMDDLSKDQNVTETDVTGTCKTEYKSVSNGYYSIAVRKTKDILTCTDRHDYRSILQMVPYDEPSDVQSNPLMKTTHECDQVIQKGGVLQSTTCTEMHVYRPFSNGQSGGVTFVKQTLTYNTNKRRVYSRKDTISSRDSLLFDHSATRPNAQQARQLAEQKLKEICESTSYDVRPESPRLFSELVYALKNLDKQTMEEIFRQLKTNSLCPSNNKAYKTFLDALPVVGTGSSVSLMTSLITHEDVSKIQAAVWIPSLAFIKDPTSEMLVDAKPLIDSDKFREEALLPVSSMVNNFCFRSSECDQSYAVLSVMGSLERNIAAGCDASGKNFHQTLLTLRAIGNAGHATRAVSVLNKCLTNSYNPLEIRVAAVNAFRRMPCDAESTELWNTYENANLDSELRIAAYQALMRCPSDETLGKMAASLGGELDEQVGAFVYSHMTNLRQTSDPHKQMVARAMDNLIIPSKYESNPMKASTNLEISALINKINTGFVAESNLVWSNNAQVPRSASANLTVELFGQSINLVDFGGRLEGLEHLIKHLLGHGTSTGGKTFNYRGSLYGRIFGNEMFFVHTDKFKFPKDKSVQTWLEMLINLAENHELSYTFSKQLMDVGMTIPSVAGLPIDIQVNASAVVDLFLKGKADLRRMSSAPRSLDIDGEIRPSAAMEITGTMSVDAFVTKTGLRMRNTLHTSTSLKGRIQMERGELITVELDSPKEKMEIFDARSKFFILHNNIEQEQRMITENRKELEACTSNKLAEITGAVLCGEISFPNASMQSEGPYFPLTGPTTASLVLRKTDTHSGYKLLVKNIQNRKQSICQISFNTPGSQVNRMILIDMTVNYPRKSLAAEIVTPWKKAVFAGDMINQEDTQSISGSLTVDSSDIYAVTAETKVSQSGKQVYRSSLIEIRRPGAEKLQFSGSISTKGKKSMDVNLSLSGLNKKPYILKTSLSNGDNKKSIQASVSADGGKNVYSVDGGFETKVASKKISTQNSLEINIPKRRLVLAKVSASLMENKSFKFDGALDSDTFMRKPASVSVLMTKAEKKRRGTSYNAKANVKSSAINGDFKSNVSVKKNGFMSTKTTIDYNIPRVAKNKVTLSGKIKKRTTRYTINGDVNVQKNPEYNVAVNVEIDSKKKHSEAEVEIKYGKNPKDRSKRFYLNTVLDKRALSLKHANLDYHIKVEAPEHDLKMTLSGDHKHSSSLIDSKVTLVYGKKKDLKTALFYEDKSKKRVNIQGSATVSWPEAEYVISSSVKEEGKKHYSYDMALKRNGGDVVKLITKAISSKNPSGAVVLDVIHPDRHMRLQLNGEKAKDLYDGSVVAEWDVGKDENKKITLSGSTYNKKSRNAVSVGGDVSFTSPFENFENVDSSIRFGSDRSQYDLLGKMNLGKRKNFMTNIILQKPVSLKFFSGSIEAETPFKKMRKASAQILHTWEDKVETVVKGTLNKENAKLHVEGEGTLDKFNGKASFTSTIANAEDISLSVSHALSSEDINSIIQISHNSKPYRANLVGNLVRRDWQIQTNGDLTLSSPENEVSTVWEHNNDKRSVSSKVKGKWNKDKLNIHLTGSHESTNIEKINAELRLDSSRKAVRDVVISFNHKHGSDMIKTKAELTKRGKTKALSDVKLLKSDNSAGLDFTLVSPYNEDINGKFEAKYDNYPMTALGEFQWHPRKKVTAETSLNAGQWHDASFEIALATPVRGYRNINFRASNRKDGAESVSQAILDYEQKKSIGIETRHSFEGQYKMARVRLSTPFDQVKSMEAGLNFNGKATDFDSSADFEMAPLVGKFQGSAKFRHDNDMTGTLRLDTPYPEYPYFELSASSNNQGRVRKSRVEARLHPRQVYSTDATYSFDMPISFEANINSPYPEYDNLGLVFQHNHSPSSVISHGELRYQPDKKIEGDLNADWSSNIEGSMIVKTPFSGYEDNKVTLRHHGDLEDFSSHGEVNVARKSVVADANFKMGRTTTGDFVLSSPIPGMENLKVEIMKKGKAKNFKGEVAITVNDDKAELAYQHTLKKKLLGTSLKLKSPYHENIKLSIEHKIRGDSSFSNEVSANYGRKYQIDSDISFDSNHPDVKGYGTIKYRLGRGRNTVKLDLNKNGELSDMSFTGNGAFNDDEITIFGTWKNVDGLQANIQLNTPFDDFKNTGITVSHNGRLDAFKSSGSITYMDDKTIKGDIDLTADVPKLIRLDSNLETPFETLPSVSLAFNHNFDKYRKTIRGDASLTTPVADIGVGSLTYEKRGDFDDLTILTNAKQNGKQVAGLKLTHETPNQEVHSKFEFESPYYHDLTLSFDHTGDLNRFNTKASGTLDSDNFSAEISKSGPIEDITVFSTVRYNSDAVAATGVWNSREGYVGSLEVKTPFEGYENSKLEANGEIDEEYKNVAGKIALSTTVNDFGTSDISFSKSGSLDDLVVEGSILKNNIELGNIKITNTRSKNELHSTFSSRGSKVPEAVASIDHSGDMNSFETKAAASMGGKEIIDTTVTFDQDDATLNAGATVRYDIEAIGSSSASLNIEKDGKLSDFKIKVVGSHDDDKRVAIDLNRDRKLGLIEGNVEVKTPIEGAEFTKVDYRYTTQENGLTIYAFAEYGESKRIACDLSASTSPNVDFRVLIKTPFEDYEEMTAKATFETTWPRLSVSSEVDAGNGRRVTLSGTLDASRDINGNIALSTPLDGFSNVGLSFEHSGKLKNFKSQGRVTYKDGKEINGNIQFKLRKCYLSAELNTPFSGHRNMKVELSQRKTQMDRTVTTYLKYGRDQVFHSETTITTLPRPGFAVTIKTPVEDYTNMEASVSYDNSWPKFELNSKASAGSDKEFSLDASFDASDDISGSVDLRTPIDDFNNIGMSFSHVQNADRLTSNGKIVFMNGKEINGKVDIERNDWRGLAATVELNTPFEDAEETKLELTFDDTAPSYGAGYSLTLGGYNAYSANGKLNVYSPNNVDGTVEVVLPIDGMEYTKAAYQHNYDSRQADGSLSLTYGDSKTVSTELKSVIVPYYDTTITVKTPFEGYENMQGSTRYENNNGKYDFSTSLNLGNSQSFSLTSDLDLSAQPFRASTQINTPYNDYRKMELVLTHEGSPSDFRCTGFLSSPITDTINAAANMRYNTLSDMEGSASIKSSFEGMDDLQAEITNSDSNGEKKVRALLGWTSGKQIVFDGIVSQKEGWSSNKVNGDLTLTTPFKAVRKLGVQAEHTDKRGEVDQSLVLKLNGKKLLDVDTEFSSKDKHKGSVTFRKPLPMQYTVSASSNGGLHEAELLANWNRDETDSNVHITASMNDQTDGFKRECNIDIGLEHASRKMGIVHKLSTSNPEASSFGKIYWDSDADSRIFYDLKITENRRRHKNIREGTLKLGLPSQTLGLTGSHSDNKVKQSGDVVFSWDADRSDKQIGLKGTITRGDRIKGDITLSMPAIRKEIHMDSEITVKGGRIILDTRTDISYSKDSRKTLTLTSKLEDISDYYSPYNYSLALGVSHPYTNVDIQMTSHLGCSDEKMTFGLSTDYLTARRQNKNLGLLAEINKLKRQLSLQITNPTSKMEYIAAETSQHPYQVRMLSKVNDAEAFRSDFILDENKKSIELNVFEGQEGIRLSAGYPSLREFRGEISRISYNQEQTEALLAVRLNNTRLMHTRLHWDPLMTRNLLQSIRERVIFGGIEELNAFAEVRAALSDEIAGKYKDITTAFNEEVRPLVGELDQELEYLGRQITKLSRAMQKAYRNNDFYLQNMGPTATKAYKKIQEKLQRFKQEYNEETKNLIKSLNEGLDNMLTYPIKERYDEVVSNTIAYWNGKVESTLSMLESFLGKIDDALTNYRNGMLQTQHEAKDALYNSTYMTYISDTLSKIDMRPYMPSWEVPEEYTNVIYDTAGRVGSKVGYLLEAPGLRHIKHGVNEVYQQGVWAYTYWELEKNIYTHSQNILILLEEIIRDELGQFIEEIENVYHPITVWDPENGEVQAEFKLPVDIDRLDEVPDLKPLAKHFTIYLPDQSSLEAIYKYMPGVWSNNTELREQLDRYQPTKNLNKGRRHRRRHHSKRY